VFNFQINNFFNFNFISNMLTSEFERSTIPLPNSILKNVKVIYQKLIFKILHYKLRL